MTNDEHIDAPNSSGSATDGTEFLGETADHYGHVYLPGSGEGSRVGEYRFLLNRDEGAGGFDVSVGTPVTAETREGSYVGVVVDMRTYGDDQGPVTADIAGMDAVGKFKEVMIATVQVFWSPRLRPVLRGKVRRATREEVLKATGYDKIEWPIPSGCVDGGRDTWFPVYFDGRALLGPEAAHLMVSGLSGQAAKTSYMGVLMAGALQSDVVEHGESVAALVFNVKGEDMLYLDQAPEAGYELEDIDLAMYEAMGLEPKPFDDVTVYAPPLLNGDPNSARTSAAILNWDLVEIWRYLGYILNIAHDDEKLQSFMAEYEAIYMRSNDPSKAHFKTLDGMAQFFSDVLDVENEDGEKNTYAWRNHHSATLWRIRRMMGGLVPRMRGLLTGGTANPTHDIATDNWTHGQVVVVDLAGLRPDAQSMVIARTCERMLKEAEDGDLGVDHLIVMTDELNVFAPQGSTAHTGVRRILQRISTQGRYAGISLFGAAQKLSKIDELTRDNAATRAMGITPDAELASGVYGRMQAGLAEQIATLERGQMALSHYSYRAPLVVRFPRPAWRTGRAKTRSKKKTSLDLLGMSPSSVSRLTEGVDRETVDEILARSSGVEDAKRRLEQARRPDMHKAALHEPYQTDVDDPYGDEDPFDVKDVEGFTLPT